MSFLKSFGLKRRIVAALAFILDITQQIPGLEQFNLIAIKVLGVLGGSALLHAGGSGTLDQEKLAGAVSFLYLLITLSAFYPPLLPLIPVLTKAAGVLSALKLGQVIGAN